MSKRLIAVLLGVSIALAGSAVVSAKGGSGGKSGPKRAYQFKGTVVDADGDDDALTDGPFVIEVTKANGNGKRYLRDNPGPVTVNVSEKTRYKGEASSAADIADGDVVKVKARKGETAFDASRVREKAVEDPEAE